MAVSNNQRRPVVLLCFNKGTHRLGVVRAHGYPCHVHITVANGLHGQIFFRRGLAGKSKFGYTTQRCCLGHLTAGIGVHFSIQHQQVHIPTRRQHMVQTTVTDIVRPAITTNNPHAFAHQIIRQAEQQFGFFGIELFKFILQDFHPFALFMDSRFRALVGLQDGIHQILANLPAQGFQQFPGLLGVFIQCQAKAQTKLGIVFEQGVGPGRPSTFFIERPGSGGEVSTVNGRTSRSVGHNHAVAEQLGG